MHLLRVRVPDFRVLKDVDISFEKEFIPKVFPLGSQNGGGKSTLLQLIFVLLHCSNEPRRVNFLRNFLSGFNLTDGQDKRVLAIIDIWDGEKVVELEFFLSSYHFINLISDSNDESTEDKYSLTSAIKNLTFLKKERSELLGKKTEFESIWRKLNLMIPSEKDRGYTKSKWEAGKEQLLKFLSTLNIDMSLSENDFRNAESFREISKFVKYRSNMGIKQLDIKSEILEKYINSVKRYLKSQDCEYIIDSSLESNLIEKNEIFLCHLKNIEIDRAKNFLHDLSERIFLAAPSTQVFLFLSQDERKSLFSQQNDKNNDRNMVNIYQNSLKDARLNLYGLFTYDFLTVDILIDSFKAARDRDFKEAIENNGKYGNSYKTLLDQLNALMGNKIVNLSSNFSEITFKLDKPDGNVELYPEDLSHGELKRLSIYMWLKHLDIKDAIVLMDEVDIALHPDWQFRIVGDLTEWSPTNQYILATHSYELCQALTPSHVKVLEPKLAERRITQL